MHHYIIYFFNGTRQIIYGKDFLSACRNLNIKSTLIDFYSNINNSIFVFDSNTRTWVHGKDEEFETEIQNYLDSLKKPKSEESTDE